MPAVRWITGLLQSLFNRPADPSARESRASTLRVTRLEPRWVLNGSPVPLDPQTVLQQTLDAGPSVGTANLMIVQAPETPQVVSQGAPATSHGSQLHLVRTGDQISIRGDGLTEQRVAADGSLLFLGGNSADTLVIDFSGGNPIPLGGVVFEGGGGFDRVQFVGGAADSVVSRMDEAGHSLLEVDGRLLEFRQVESLTDQLSAQQRTIIWRASSDVELTESTADWGPDGRQAELVLSGEGASRLQFTAPESRLTLDLGAQSTVANRAILHDVQLHSTHVTVLGDSRDELELSGRVSLWADTAQFSAGQLRITGTVSTRPDTADASTLRFSTEQALHFETGSRVELSGGDLYADAGRQGTLIVSGTLDSSATGAGAAAGSITLLGARVGVTGTGLINVSGRSAGEVLIGGAAPEARDSLPGAERVSILSGARILADGFDQGSGGRIIIWSEGVTDFRGFASVEGGATGGQGGLIEVSSQRQLNFRGSVDLGADHERSGVLLLDPQTIRIRNGTDPAPTVSLPLFESPAGGESVVYEDTLEGITGTILLQATDEIILEDLSDNELKLQTDANLTLQTRNGAGDLATGGIRFDSKGDSIVASGTGTITIQAGVAADANGVVSARQGSADITVGQLSTESGKIVVEASRHVVLAGNVSSAAGEISIRSDSVGSETGSVTVNAKLNISTAAPTSTAITIQAADMVINIVSKLTVKDSAGGITIRGSVASRPMNVGGADGAVNGLNLTDAELTQLVTTSTGTITLGDDNQTGDITFTTATPGSVDGTSLIVHQSGTGAIRLTDSASEAALTMGSGALTIAAGTGGVIATNAANQSAEIASSGPSVTFNTEGAIGNSTNPIQFSSSTTSGSPVLSIGTGVRPQQDVVLQGFGGLTLGSVLLDQSAVTPPGLTVVAGGPIRQTSGTSIAASFLVARTLSDAGGAITLDNSTNTVGTLRLEARSADDSRNAAGAITFRNAASVVIDSLQTAGDVSLVADGDVTQTGGITANRFQVTTRDDTGADIALGNPANTVTRLNLRSRNGNDTATTAGNITYQQTGALILETLATQGNISLTTDGSITQTGSLSARALAVSSFSDSSVTVTLDNPANEVASLEYRSRDTADSAVGGGNLTYRDASGFDLQQLTTKGDVTLTAGGAITQTGDLQVRQLEATTLSDSGAAITLDGATNSITRAGLATRTADGTALAGGTIALRTTTSLILETLGTLSTAKLTAGGAVTQTTALTADSLTVTTLSAGGALIRLDSASNAVGTIALRSRDANDTANAGGTITYRDVDKLEVEALGSTASASLTAGGTVTQSGAITVPQLTVRTLSNSAAAITLTNTGNDTERVELRAQDALGAGTGSGAISYRDLSGFDVAGVSTTGSVSLQGENSVTQSSEIAANGLALRGLGSFTFGLTTNNINILAATIGGGLTFTNSDTLTVGTVQGIAGISLSTTSAGVLLTAPIFVWNNNLSTTAGAVAFRSSTGPTADVRISGANVQLTTAGADVDLSAVQLSATNTGRNLTVNASGIATDAGSIQLGGASSAGGGTLLQNLTLQTSPGLTSNPTSVVVGESVTLSGQLLVSKAGATSVLGPISAPTVVLSSDEISIKQSVTATTRVDLRPATTGNAITLGAKGTLNDSILDIAAEDLAFLTTPVLQIGDTASGAINVTAVTTFSGGVDRALILETGAGISGGGSIVVPRLRITAGAAVTLNGANDVDLLSAKLTAGSLTFRDADELTISTVDGQSGITTANDGEVTLRVGNDVLQTAAIRTGTLSVVSTSGAVSAILLTHALNDVSRLQLQATASGLAGINFRDANGFEVNHLAAGGDIQLTAGGDITQLVSTAISAPRLTVTTLQDAGGRITLNSPLNSVAQIDLRSRNSADTSIAAGDIVFGNRSGFDVLRITTSGNVELNAATGSVSQSGPIAANGLVLLGGASYELTEDTNAISVLSARLTTPGASVTYHDGGGLTVGTVNGLAGITTPGSGSVTLVARGAVAQSQAISTDFLRVSTLNNAGRSITLNHTGNSVRAIALQSLDQTGLLPAAGNIEYQDADDLIVAGLTTAGSITLSSPGNVTQSQALSAGQLLLLGNGSYTLNHPDNNTVTLAASIGGGLLYRDLNSLTLGTVGGVSGLNTTTIGEGITIDAPSIFWNASIRTAGGPVGFRSSVLPLADVQIGGSGVTLTTGGGDVDFSGARLTSATAGRDLTIDLSGGIVTGGNILLGAIDAGSGQQLRNITLTTGTGGPPGSHSVVVLGDISISGQFHVSQAQSTSLQGKVTAAQILIVSNEMDLQRTLTAATRVELRPASDGATVNLGTKGAATDGNLGLTAAELALISAPLLQIGGTTTGVVTVSQAITFGAAQLPVLVVRSQSGIFGSGGLSVSQLRLNSTGPVNLSGNNDVDVLAADVTAGSFAFRDVDDLIVGSVAGQAGVTTPGTEGITLTAGGSVRQTEALTTGALSVRTLSNSGAIIVLEHAQNSVKELSLQSRDLSNSINATGNISYRDADGLSVVTLATTGEVLLTALEGVSETPSASITVGRLAIVTLNNAGGDISLGNGTHDVTSLSLQSLNASGAVATAGTIVYRDVDGFVVDRITTTAEAQLLAGGAVSQTGRIAAAGLLLQGTGSFLLNDDTNAVSRLAAVLSGTGQSLEYHDANSLQIGEVGSVAGVTLARDGALTLVTRGAISQTSTGAIVANRLSTTTRTPGGAAIELAAALNDVTDLQLQTRDVLDAAPTAGRIRFQDINGFRVAGISTTSEATLSAAGDVTQSGAIGAAGLRLEGSGSFLLKNDLNSVTRLAARLTGDGEILDYHNAVGFEVGTVDGLPGITTTATGTVSLVAAVDVTQTEAISTDSLVVRGTGSFILDHSSNLATRFAAELTGVGASVTYHELDGFEIASVQGTAGISTDRTGKVTLVSDGTVTQSRSITTGGLLLRGAGSWDLGQAPNTIQVLAARLTGVDSVLRYQDIDDLEIGTTDAVAGVVTESTGRVELSAGGQLTQTASLRTGDLLLSSGGATVLQLDSNDVDRLAATVTGAGLSLVFHDVDGFEIASLAGATGLTTTDTGEILLAAGGDVTQTARVSGGGLLLQGTGSFVLTDNQNSVARLAAQLTGAGHFLEYHDVDQLELGVVGGIAGVTTDRTEDISLFTGGDVTQTAAVVTAGLLLQGTGSYQLLVPTNEIRTLAARLTTSGAALEYHDFSALEIGTVKGVDGVSTLGLVSLLTGGDITQSQSLSSDALRLVTSGQVLLTLDTNDTSTLAAQLTGVGQSLEFHDLDGFHIGTLAGLAGINATDSGRVTLVGSGDITQSAAIVTSGLELQSSGSLFLDAVENQARILAAHLTGPGQTLRYTDLNELDIGTVNQTSGLILGETGTAVLVTGSTVTQSAPITGETLDLRVFSDASANITLDSPDNDLTFVTLQIRQKSTNDRGEGTITYVDRNGLGIVTISTAGTARVTSGSATNPNGIITQTNAIDAGRLEVSGFGQFELKLPNSVDTLVSNVTGSLNFHNEKSLQVGDLTSSAGVTATGDVRLDVIGDLNLVRNIDAGKQILITATGSTNFESQLPDQSTPTGVVLTAGSHVRLLGLRPFLSAAPINFSQNVEVGPDGTANVTFVAGRSGELGMRVEIDWGDGTRPDSFVQAPSTVSPDGLASDQFLAGVPRTVTHVYTLEAILSRLGGGDAGKLSGSNLFEVKITTSVDPDVSFNATSVSPAGFIPLTSSSQVGQSVQGFDLTPRVTTDQFNIARELTVNRMVIFVTNPGIGLAGTELSQFGSREFNLPVQSVLPQPSQTGTTVLVNTATTGANDTSPGGVITSREDIFRIRRIFDENALRGLQGDDGANPEIRPEWLGLKQEQLTDLEVVRKSFLRLPDGRYQVTQQRGESGGERVILDIQLRQGRPTPVEDLQKPQLKPTAPASVDTPAVEAGPGTDEPATRAAPRPDESAPPLSRLDPVRAAPVPDKPVLDGRAALAIAELKLRLGEPRRPVPPMSTSPLHTSPTPVPR